MYSILCEPHTVYGLSCECMVHAVCCTEDVWCRRANRLLFSRDSVRT